MNKLIHQIIILSFLLMINSVTFAKHNVNDANIIGHVVCNGDHIPYANIVIKGTTIGTLTDESGHFQIINLNPGNVTLVFQMIGYKTQSKEIKIVKDKTVEVKFEVEEDALLLDEIVVTGSKQMVKRAQSITIVNSIPIAMLKNTSAISISEGLNFCSGLRMENNCQNCGFNQIRMNGLEGPYSQILINGNPIFSGLAGVYGLELIPSNMIEKIEVIKGGGSSIYGGNAIAGTVNLRLKTPKRNSFNAGYSTNLIGVGVSNDGGLAEEHIVNADMSLVTSDRRSGMSMYALNREREHYDANNDSFSEIAELKNTTFGANLFHNFGDRDKLSLDFFVINEERRGGDRFDYLNHQANISESIKHRITTTALSYTRFFRDIDLLSVYASRQKVDRKTYYGAGKSLADYGKTNGNTFSTGANYSANFEKFNVISGVDFSTESLEDIKLGCLVLDSAKINGKPIVDKNGKQTFVVSNKDNETIADQVSSTFGIFTQLDYKIFKNLKISAGARIDKYKITNDHAEKGGKVKEGTVFCPRINFLYDINSMFQLRGAYSAGYRAPQIFDEDLHIETSAAKKIIHVNSPDLEQENSHSITGSLNFRKQFSAFSLELLTEGFFTKIDNPFANSMSSPNSEGTVTFTRINDEDGAKVAGVNIELRINTKDVRINLGFTSQIAEYIKEQELLEGDDLKKGHSNISEKDFLRTPKNYGFFVVDYDFGNFCLNVNGKFTGETKMLHDVVDIKNNLLIIPSEAHITLDEDGNEHYNSIHTTSTFFDIGAKLSYTYKINGTSLEIFSGVKNILNSYQDNFDKGEDRDPGFIFGPMQPTTVYAGINLSL